VSCVFSPPFEVAVTVSLLVALVGIYLNVYQVVPERKQILNLPGNVGYGPPEA